jgi:putative copper export protein
MPPEIIPALIRTAIFVGAMLLIGAGLFARYVWVNPIPDSLARRLKLGAWLGMLIVLSASLIDVAFTANRVFAGLDFPTFWSYLTGSRHGNASMARAILAAALFGLGLGIAGATKPATGFGIATRAEAGDGPVDRILHAVLGLALLATISLTSHAGVNGWATPAFFADLIHLVAMTAWVGAITYLAWSASWGWKSFDATMHALARVSGIGLTAVMAMTATGVFASFTRIPSVPALTNSSYGQALIIKLVIVLAILLIAAANRFVLLPALTSTRSKGRFTRFSGVLQIESLLLVATLFTSGYLSSQPPPEAGVTLRSEVAFKETVGPWTIEGIFKPAYSSTELEVRVTDATGKPAPETYMLSGRLNMMDHAMQPVPLRVSRLEPGTYQASGPLFMSGHWEAILQLPQGIVRVKLRAQ